MVKITVILIILLTMACNKKHEATEHVNITNRKIEQESIKVHDSLTNIELMSLSKSDAVLKLGKPIKQEQFILNDLQGEFRIGLYNIYTKEERLSETILIDESTWEKDKNTWFTVWYEVTEDKVIPIDSLSWKKGSEF